MRARILIAAALVAAAPAGSACVYKRDAGGLPGWPDGSTFEVPPPHMVVGDGPVGVGSTTEVGSGGGPVLGPPSDARPAPDAPVAPDGAGGAGGGGGGDGDGGPKLDAFLGGDTGGREAGAGCTPCNLVRQDCPTPSQACYPDGIGGGCCDTAGGSGPGAECFQSSECDRGAFCSGPGGGEPSFCREFCNPAVALCPSGQCQPLAGYPNTGVCVP